MRGVMSLMKRDKMGKVHRRAGFVGGSLCVLSCCRSSERQIKNHCCGQEAAEGLSTNSCFSFMENRSKGINCPAFAAFLKLWATFPFLGPGNNSGREMGEPGPEGDWPQVTSPGMVLKHEQGTLAASEQKP